ncbi:Ni/Fe-hydrogenase, b-type cytochrome subunit [Skermanella sp. TT6]|uniref:Ni/Fe-hydrogenase, b-type cytochrome subunit n=1 Tax=Skermanella cutis TaxID=2775420 RepID=A0ABX7BDG0_9PROT|nr:Ni/Fe-hydrogenase, b-type cytochrome subunit [Skermanella sp. TT6]QQP91051.1 Ni/Fe-hydrogenase, b-type cytochrome subunit [Skermanella sp. TT6]
MTAHVDKTPATSPADDEIADLATARNHLQVRQTAIYVYEWPVRLWHWTNALAILVLAVTGYLIGSPPGSQPGEASDAYLMGYIRFAHFAAGFVMAIGMAGRIYWAFVGNVHARQMFVLPFWSGKFWREVLIEAQWYAFMRDYPKKYIGHNPLAQLAMVTIYSLGSIFMIVTGFALYSEGAGQGSWLDTLFGWVIPLAGNSQNLHTIHHLGMWVIVTFVIIHVYAAIREDIMSRQSMISTMISGWRMFKDDGK